MSCVREGLRPNLIRSPRWLLGRFPLVSLGARKSPRRRPPPRTVSHSGAAPREEAHFPPPPNATKKPQRSVRA